MKLHGTRYLEHRIPPVVTMFCCAAGIAVCRQPEPGYAMWFFWLCFGLAVVLLVAGSVLIGLGIHQFKQHQTTVNPLTPAASEALVTSGVYALSRNPMYLGMLLLLLAEVFWLQSWVGSFFAVGFYVFINHFQITPEESQLKKRFGEAYQTYCKQVRRWL